MSTTTLALVSPVFPPYRSGMGTVVLQNAQMAAESGMETIVYTPWYPTLQGRASKKERVSGLTVERLRPIFSYGNAAFLVQLFWKLRTADIIHLHYPAIGMELPVLFASLFGKKLVVTYHMNLVGKGWFMKGFFRLYSTVFLPCVLHAATTVFITSQDYAEQSVLLKPFLTKIQKKIIELPNCVDTVRFVPTAGYPSLNGHPIQDYLLFVGALDSAHYSKGVPVLLDAFSRISNADARLVIIGDGDLRHSYEQQARTLGIANSVTFTGSVSHSDLPRWYAHARCLLLPSTDATEAFGIVIIEAGASGVPAIASRLPGIRSVINEGITGFLITPGSASECAETIGYALAHPEEMHAMGTAARAYVQERYAYDKVKELYLSQINVL